MRRSLMIALFCLTLALPVQAYNKTPGKGVTVNPARATWNTGYFQEALVREALEELGFKVKKTKELANPIFYQSVKLGDVDYWTNGWFPMHKSQLPKGFSDKAETIGYVAKAGGLQGYLVSKKRLKSTISSLSKISSARKSKKPLTTMATARPI